LLTFSGYHFYNEDPNEAGPTHLYKTIIKFLEQGTVFLPNPKAGGQLVQFNVKELGIGYPVLIQESPIQKDYRIPNPNYTGPGVASGSLAGSGVEPGSVGPGGFPMPPGFEGPGGIEPAGVGGPGSITPGFPASGFPASGFPGSGFPASGAPGSGYPGGSPGSSGQAPTAPGEIPKDSNGEPAYFVAPRYRFSIQFCWQPIPLTKRLQIHEEAIRQQAAQAATQQAGNTSSSAQVAGVMPDGGSR
jgi:hypothetical protein